MEEIETRTIRKVMWRLMPFLVVCYFVAYLDRVNVGFAKLQMNAALGLSEAAYGFGAGLFFIAYFLLEVPSNLALDKFGARLWIARIMFSWGLISALFAFISPISRATGISNEYVFYILRFLLGIAEAGFFPGIIFYLTLWFPSVYRARVVAMFMLAIPFSSIVGAPVSGALLNITGGGLEGWQWLFILEALPSLVMSVVVIFYLTDRPAQANWLQADEKTWLETRLETERKQKVAVEHMSIGKALSDPRVLACSFVYFCLNAASYGVAFFLPTIVKGFGVSNFQTGLLSALPFVFGAVGMVLLGRSSDRTLKRREHVCFAMMVAAVGVAGAGLVSSPVLILGLLCLSQIGVSATPPLLWPIPSAFLTGSSAAAGIAAINSIGNLSGFAGPYVMGYLKDLTGTFTAGLLVLGAVTLAGGLVAMTLKVSRDLEDATARKAAPAE
ncbi:D-galactonate transporter [Methylobacterium sp. 174MFSha1.1]|uniref:MFS transporter n=1 Tax=Methylobacterium sp. 174MFSha1.1 TaxID=1502749 RepID=UPI0008F3BA1B|nr:MFS transporter [Methylobacterium sp. 174MFSha1.1]SFU85588.1 D-galactonate transporter [Methylobacterium sp. 174MFSha1.1]